MTQVIIFWLGSIFGVVGGIIACSIHRIFVSFFFVLMLVSMMFPQWSINFFSRESYRAQSRGLEIHLADLCALVLVAALLMRPHLRKALNYRMKINIPLFLPFFGLIIFSIFSWILTDYYLPNPFYDSNKLPENTFGYYQIFETKLYPFFENFKLVKSFMIYWVCFYLMSDKAYLGYLLKFSAAAIIAFSLMALIDRYFFGIHRVSVFYHVNVFNCLIAMMGSIVLPQIFEEKNNIKSLFYGFVAMLALLTIILTISRSSLLAYVISIGIVVLVYLLRKFTMKTVCLMGILFFGSLFVMMKGMDTLIDRFVYKENTAGGLEGRSALKQGALIIAKDHKFGVGMGNYSAYSISRYSNEITDLGVMTHNVWYLTLAELGFAGLGFLVIYWIRVGQMALSDLFKLYRGNDGFQFAITLGCALALLSLQIQLIFHFSWRDTTLLYFTQVVLAVISSRYVLLKIEKKNLVKERGLKIDGQTITT